MCSNKNLCKSHFPRGKKLTWGSAGDVIIMHLFLKLLCQKIPKFCDVYMPTKLLFSRGDLAIFNAARYYTVEIGEVSADIDAYAMGSNAL